MVGESSEEKPKKKRGRPKGSKSKKKPSPTKEKPVLETPKEEIKIEEEPSVVSASEAALKASEEAVKAAEVKPTSISGAVEASKKAAKAAKDAAKAEVEARAALEKARAAEKAKEEALEKEYQAVAAEITAAEAIDSFTNKRGVERIFRREMGEPEFWLEKKQRVAPRPVLSKDEEEMISKQVEVPADQTPQYKPEHILSAEYGGTSNYEIGIKNQREEVEERLNRLRNDPNSSSQEIKQAEEDLKTLDYLYENYYDGMNVFRTAKGGRSKLRE